MGAALLLVACAGTEPDVTPGRDAGTVRDAGPARDGGPENDAGPERDAGPARDGGPRRDAGSSTCPPAEDYVGDGAWTGALVVPSGLTLCRFASQFEPIEDVYARRGQATLPAGTFLLPTEATDEAIFVPMCLPSGSELSAGTVSAERGTRLDDATERYHVTVTQPAADGTSVQLTTSLPTDDPTMTIDGLVSTFGALALTHCREKNCFEDQDLYLPCALTPNMCDRLTFMDGDIAIDQFHWAGSVGAGFAAAMRARGTFRGTNFDVSAYPQLTMAYGHHAFTRSLWFTFDAPIDGVCALRFAEVGEYGQLDPVELLDCDGNLLGTSAITADSHEFRMSCN